MAEAGGRSRGAGSADLLPSPERFASGLVRGVVVVVLGLITSFALFWLMQAIVSVTATLAESGARLAIEFVRLKHDETPELKKREAPKREKPEQQPAPPQMNVAKNMNPSEAVGEIIPIMDAGTELQEATSLSTGGTDTAPVPLVRVDPDYPPRAQQQGVKGFVEVEFTISPLGTVQDVVVLRAKPPGVFEKATLEAVRRWKYSPMIQNGVAVARPGVQTRFLFNGRESSR
jgi:protein TonB